MSTLGKVLVVLNMLLVLGWMFLMAAVADLNANWGKKLADLEKVTEQTRASIPPELEKIVELRREAAASQVVAERVRVSFRNELTRLQRSESETKEARSRFDLQQKASQAARDSSRERSTFRLQEKLLAIKELDDKEAEVKAQMAENNELRDELKKLQDSFKETLADNKALMTKVRNAEALRGKVGKLDH